MNSVEEIIEENEGWEFPIWIKVRLIEDHFSPVTRTLYKAGSLFFGRKHFRLDVNKKTFAILKNAISVDGLPSPGSIYGEGYGCTMGEIMEIWQAKLTAKKLWSKE